MKKAETADAISRLGCDRFRLAHYVVELGAYVVGAASTGEPLGLLLSSKTVTDSAGGSASMMLESSVFGTFVEFSSVSPGCGWPSSGSRGGSIARSSLSVKC